MKIKNTSTSILIFASILTFNQSIYAEEIKVEAFMKKLIDEGIISERSKLNLRCDFVTKSKEGEFKTRVLSFKKHTDESESSIAEKIVNLKKEIEKVNEAQLPLFLKSAAVCDNIIDGDASASKSNFSISCKGKSIYDFSLTKECVALNQHINSTKYRSKDTFSSTRTKDFSTVGMTCYAEGSIAADFDSCVEFLKAYTSINAGQMVISQGQQVWAAGEAQTAFAEAEGKADDPKAALNAQKKSIDAQGTVFKQKAAIESGKLAYLVNLWKKIPDVDTLKGKVDEKLLDPNFGLLQNTDNKDAFKEILFKIGGEAVSNMLLAKIADDRSGQISGAMAKVDAFKPVDFSQQAEDAQVQYCQQNPADPKCMSGNLNYQVDPFSGESFTFGGTATGTSYSDNTIGPDGSVVSKGPSGSSPNKKFNSIGNAITGVDKSNRLMDESSAASISKGNGPGASGGGPGGGSSGGAGSASGGAPAGQKQQEGTTSPGTGSKIAYSGGSGVSVFGTGLGINGKKAGGGDDKNPFADMFKNKQANNGALNFRGPASVGKKDGNIFDQISTRYKDVNSKGDRLIEYKQVQP